ncbi:TonB-dependent receptor plug domain-containing protein [Bacteroides thetaiotaomicron]|nr:TonB-dependent receptor plug domain-containing protein [Bacteroides thetaiotaomicron]
MQGTVTDETGESLPGVSVVVKGTTNGTVTDVNGKYSIQATSKRYIVFHICRYGGTRYKKVAGQKTINVVMKDDVASLDEVIVVGYGTAKKQSLTGAVSAVKGDELLKAPETNVSSLLGGRLPGISSVQVSENRVMTQAVLRVRGSIYNVTYIVDGMPRSINDIDPNDIESVSVLKDGASAAVYGLKGAGGVIIVTTKRGQEGKSRITYNGSIGASMNANFPQFMNGPQFAYYYNMADMMDKLANGSITDMKQYTPVF